MKKAMLICLIIITLSTLSIAVSGWYYGYHFKQAIEDKGVTFMSHIRINVLNGGSLDIAAHKSQITINEVEK